MLTGIAPVQGGYRITIENKKNTEQKKVIEPGGSGEFKVVSVKYDPDILLDSTVILSHGSIQGTVGFEPELISLKAAPAVAVNAQVNANLPPGVNVPPVPGANGQPQVNTNTDPNAQRQPRPRIVPPPTGAGGVPQPQNAGGSSQQRRDFRRR